MAVLVAARRPVETLTNLAEPESTSPKCYRATDPSPRNSEPLHKCWQIRRNQQWRKSCWSAWFSSQIHGMDGDFVWLKERLYSLASPSRASAVAPNQHVHTPWWHRPLHSKSSESPQHVNRHHPARFPLIHSDTDTAATSFPQSSELPLGWGGTSSPDNHTTDPVRSSREVTWWRRRQPLEKSSRPAETCVTIDSAARQTRRWRLKGFMEWPLLAINRRLWPASRPLPPTPSHPPPTVSPDKPYPMFQLSSAPEVVFLPHLHFWKR